MPTFKSLDDFCKHLKKNPKEVLKQVSDDVFKLPCPVCESVEKVKNLRNGYGKCLKCDTKFKIELEIKP